MRRIFAVLAALAAAAQGLAALAQEPPVLNIYNWNDYIDEQSLQIFTAETGIKVVYDTYDANETLDAKLRAGRSGYDLVVPTASPFLAQQVPAGLYRAVDRSALSNYRNLDADLMRRLAVYDPGNRHAIPWMWGTTGIGYDKARIKGVMADAPVDSLAMMFDPAIVARFRDCGVVMIDSPTDVFPTALVYLKRNPDSAQIADLEAATELLLAIRPFIRKFHSSEYINDLATGDACLALGFSGDIIQAAKRAREAKRGVEIVYTIPREGAQIWIDSWTMPSDAPHPQNAHRFLDFLLRPDIAAVNTNFIGYANPIPQSLPLVDAAIRNDPSIYPSEEVEKRLFAVTPKSPDYERQRTRAWTRVTTGR